MPRSPWEGTAPILKSHHLEGGLKRFPLHCKVDLACLQLNRNGLGDF